MTEARIIPFDRGVMVLRGEETLREIGARRRALALAVGRSMQPPLRLPERPAPGTR